MKLYNAENIEEIAKLTNNIEDVKEWKHKIKKMDTARALKAWHDANQKSRGYIGSKAQLNRILDSLINYYKEQISFYEIILEPEEQEIDPNFDPLKILMG